MFGFGRRSAPIDPAAKEWVEHRLNWLSSRFGRDVFLRRSVVLPTSEFFPNRYDDGEEGHRAIFEEVASLLGIDTTACPVEFNRFKDLGFEDLSGHRIAGPAAMYFTADTPGYGHVVMDPTSSANLSSRIATLAHELSHHRLLAFGHLRGDEFDNEITTDLTALFFGFGIFLANDPRVWTSGYTLWPGTNLKKPEYMTPTMFGHALAHRAWITGEDHRPWSCHLNLEARTTFKASLRYLEKTSDTAFTSTPSDTALRNSRRS